MNLVVDLNGSLYFFRTELRLHCAWSSSWCAFIRGNYQQVIPEWLGSILKRAAFLLSRIYYYKATTQIFDGGRRHKSKFRKLKWISENFSQFVWLQYSDRQTNFIDAHMVSFFWFIPTIHIVSNFKCLPFVRVHQNSRSLQKEHSCTFSPVGLFTILNYCNFVKSRLILLKVALSQKVFFYCQCCYKYYSVLLS